MKKILSTKNDIFGVNLYFILGEFMKKLIFFGFYFLLFNFIELNQALAFQKKPLKKNVIKKKKIVIKKKVVYPTLCGQIYKQTGNQLPDPDQPQLKGQLVSREIYIYKLTKVADTEGNGVSIFTKINTKFIKKTVSDKNGKYCLSLPAGNYSVFTKEPDLGFFANIFDGEMHINPVTIKKGQNPNFDITINYSAAY